MTTCPDCRRFVYKLMATADKVGAALDRRDAGAEARARIEADEIRRAYLAHRESHEAVAS